MEKFVSTKFQPLKFFEDVFSESGFQEYRKEFFKKWESYNDDEDVMYVFVNKDEDYIEHIFNWLNFPSGDKVRVTLEEDLNKRFEKEIKITKSFLEESISELIFNNVPLEPFLRRQLNKINQLFEKNEWFKNHPRTLGKILLIDSYINSQIDKKSESNEYHSLTSQELINEIFGYLKGKNAESLKIMPDSEYERLIGLINEMVNTERKPVVEKKFKVQLPKALLRYTFYVLHYKLYGILKRDYFIKFMHEAFSNFDDWQYRNLKSKFSEPPKLPSFVPEIIRKHKMSIGE